MKKIGIIGSGTMGHGIATAFSMYGYDVTIYDTNAEVLTKAKELIRQELELFVSEGYLPNLEIEACLAAITFSTNLQETVADRDYVIEAAPEVMELKQNLFKQLDEMSPPTTVLASNTSSLP